MGQMRPPTPIELSISLIRDASQDSELGMHEPG
jgi:hypothetical protein